jgi:hypothetical protein
VPLAVRLDQAALGLKQRAALFPVWRFRGWLHPRRPGGLPGQLPVLTPTAAHPGVNCQASAVLTPTAAHPGVNCQASAVLNAHGEPPWRLPGQCRGLITTATLSYCYVVTSILVSANKS